MKQKIIAVSIQKGGTGKTTTAYALAMAAKHKGYKVLAIDLDSQSNLSMTLGADLNNKGNAYDILHGKPIESAIQPLPLGIDAIAGAVALASEQTISGSAKRLKTALESVKKQYDIIIIDTPPVADEMQYNALYAADAVVIPMQTCAFSIQSLWQSLDAVKEIQQANKALKVAGIVFTQYDKRPLINRELHKRIEDIAKQQRIKILGEVRKGVAVNEANTLGRDIYQYAPKSKPAIDYMAIADQLF